MHSICKTKHRKDRIPYILVLRSRRISRARCKSPYTGQRGTLENKISVKGNFQRTDEKLREVYTQAREIAKRHDLAFIAICQASADAHGKTILDPTEMEGSKTGKFAEADLIIGVGCHAVGVNEEADTTRHLTVGKNKITGWHGTIVCLIEPQVSRYVD